MISLPLQKGILHEDIGPFQLQFCSYFRILWSQGVLWKSFFLGSGSLGNWLQLKASYPL